MATKMVFERFDSLDSFSRSFDRPENQVFKNDQPHSKYTGKEREKFTGTSTFEQAVSLFNNGWTEKADEIRRDFIKFERAEEKNIKYEKKRPATSVVGFAPHVPNAILGLPNSMIYTERQPIKAKIVRIIYNMTMNCDTDKEDIMRAGLTVLKIANSLERKGLRVRIDVNPMFSQAGGETACVMVCVKDWRQPLDIKKVAFPVAHPSMFRRFGFRWLENTPNLTSHGFLGGYGRSIENADNAKDILKECKVFEDNDYFVNVKLAKENGYDVAKTAEAIGIKNL